MMFQPCFHDIALWCYDRLASDSDCDLCYQIATLELVYLFDIVSLGSDSAFNAGLRDIMQSEKLQKVCFDAVICSLNLTVSAVSCRVGCYSLAVL